MSVPQEHAHALERADDPAIERADAAVLSTVESLMLEERTRWAMTIHDRLTQSVTSAILELQVLRHRVETDPASAVDVLAEVEQAIRTDLSEIREVLFQLDEGLLREDPSFVDVRERAGEPLEAPRAGDDRGRPRSDAGGRAGDGAQRRGRGARQCSQAFRFQGRDGEGRCRRTRRCASRSPTAAAASPR